MKADFSDVSETRKTVTIEIPSDLVDAEIARIARDYSKQARIPGFRPGKVPTTVVKQRFRDQIHHDVMQGLIPRAVEDALQQRGIEPVDTPDIRNVTLKEGTPLTFTANVETVPPIDPGDLSTITLHQQNTVITDDAVEKTLERLRERGAKLEPVEGRPLGHGDTAIVDLTRTDPNGTPDEHAGISIEIGATGNPPGFDDNLVGLDAGQEKTFVIHFPGDYTVKEMANTDVTYRVQLKEIRRRVLPPLDDEFARDVGPFESLAALRDRVRTDMQADADEHARQHVRGDLLKQLADRITFELPTSLVEREIDRRVEEFARRLMDQQIDPRKSNVDWGQFREAQREPARTAVASALVLDAIARREQVSVSDDDITQELERFAERMERTAEALRAQLDKEGGLGRLTSSLRREKAIDLAMSRAKMTPESPAPR
jgi:trigger factor